MKSNTLGSKGTSWNFTRLVHASESNTYVRKLYWADRDLLAHFLASKHKTWLLSKCSSHMLGNQKHPTNDIPRNCSFDKMDKIQPQLKNRSAFPWRLAQGRRGWGVHLAEVGHLRRKGQGDLKRSQNS